MGLSASDLKEAARALGFDLCGVAPADSFPELRFLGEWLERGYAGEMAYLQRSAARRADVRAVMPGARSVIVLGTLYNTDRPYSTEVGSDPGDGPCQPLESERVGGLTPGEAVIARYAWGDDYHDVLTDRLDRLVDWMRTASAEPFEAKADVDTGPVQERVYAQYAGLGWIGKNTCLINPELGSWIFLSEIICTLSVERDTEGLDLCGSCTRCLDACPTGALLEPHVLDATRCLSYLTIELRTAIPEDRRAALGNRVYGCDVCQEVCPYNQAPLHSPDAAWQPRTGLDGPSLVDLWRRSDADLRSLVRGTAMTRAKLTGLRRNLAVTIGNSGDRDAIDALRGSDPDRPSADDPLVAEHVRWALDRPRPTL